MLSDFDFLEEWISAENIKVDVSPVNQNEENPSFDPCKESWLKPEQVDFWKSESERLRKEYDKVIKENETFRKNIIKLRSRDKLRCKVLDEQRVRLTQLLTEKLANKEEQRKIADCEKKLEEATLCIQATEQLNKQLQELSKSYDIDRKEWNEKLAGVEGKLRELKKINNEYKHAIEITKKKRKKSLVVILELWGILQESGLCPKKHKRYIGLCKTELLKNGDISDDDELVCDKKKEDIAKKSPSCRKEAQNLKTKDSKLSNAVISPEFISGSDSSEEEELHVTSGCPSSVVSLPNCSPKSIVSVNLPSNHSNFSSEDVICKDKNTTKNFCGDGKNAGIVPSSRLSKSSEREVSITPGTHKLSLSSLEDGDCFNNNNERIGFSDKENKSNAISSPSSISSSKERFVGSELLEHSISSLEDELCSSKNDRSICFGDNKNKIDGTPSSSTSRGKKRSLENVLLKLNTSSLKDPLCSSKNNKRISSSDKKKKSDPIPSPPSTKSSKERSDKSLLPKHSALSLEDGLCTKKNNMQISLSDKKKISDVISSLPSKSSCRETSVESELPKCPTISLKDGLRTNQSDQRIVLDIEGTIGNCRSSVFSVSSDKEEYSKTLPHKHTNSSSEDKDCTDTNQVISDEEDSYDDLSSVASKNSISSSRNGLCTNKNSERMNFCDEEESNEIIPRNSQDECIVGIKNGSGVGETILKNGLALLGTLSNDSGVGKDEIANKEDCMNLNVKDDDNLCWMGSEDFSMDSLVSSDCVTEKCGVGKVPVDMGETEEYNKGSLDTAEMKKGKIKEEILASEVSSRGYLTSTDCLMSSEMKKCEIDRVVLDTEKTLECSKSSLASGDCLVSAEMKKCEVDKVSVDTGKTLESSKSSLASGDSEMKNCKVVFADKKKTCGRIVSCEMGDNDSDVEAILDKMCILPPLLQPFEDVKPPAVEKDDYSVDLQSPNNTLMDYAVLSDKCNKTILNKNGNDLVGKSFENVASNNSSVISQNIFEETTLVIQAFDQLYVIVPESEATDLKSNGNSLSPINVKPWRFNGVLMEDEFGYTKEFLTLGSNTYLSKNLEDNKTNFGKETEIIIECQNKITKEEESSELHLESLVNYPDNHNAESECNMIPSSCKILPGTESNDLKSLTCGTENSQSPNEINSKLNKSEIPSVLNSPNEADFSSKVNLNVEVPEDSKCDSLRDCAVNSPEPCMDAVEVEEEVNDIECPDSQNKAKTDAERIEVFKEKCCTFDDGHVSNERSDAIKHMQIEKETEVNKQTSGEEQNKVTKVPEVNELESECEGDVSSEEDEYLSTDESQVASDVTKETNGNGLNSYKYRINSVESSLQDFAEGLGILSSESDNGCDLSNSSLFERISHDSEDSVSFSSLDDDSSKSKHIKNSDRVCGIEDDMAEVFIQGNKSMNEGSKHLDFDNVSLIKESSPRHILPMQSIRKEEKKVAFPKSVSSFNKGISSLSSKLETTEQDKCTVKDSKVFGFMSSTQPSFSSLSDRSSTPNSKCVKSPSNYFESFTSGWSSSKIFLEKSEHLDISLTERRSNSMFMEGSKKSLFGLPGGFNKDLEVRLSPILMKNNTSRMPMNKESKEHMLTISPIKTRSEESNTCNLLSLSDMHMSLLKVASGNSINQVIEKEKISPKSSIIVRHNYKSPNKSTSSEASVNSINLTEKIQSTITLHGDDKRKLSCDLFNEKYSEKVQKIEDGEESKVLSPMNVVACEKKENVSLTESSKILSSDCPKTGFHGVKFLTGAQIRKNNSDSKEKNLDCTINTERNNFRRRSVIPFFFGAFKPSLIFKVKFRILGHFASALFIDPYASQKCSIINFGKGDLKDVLFSGKTVDKSNLTPKFSGVMFYKIGVFARNAFSEQYLIPRKPVINTFYPKYKIISSSNADSALFSPIVNEGETIVREGVASESKASAVIRYGNSLNHKTHHCPVKVPDSQIGLPSQLCQRIKKKETIFHTLPDSPVDIASRSGTSYVDRKADASGPILSCSTVHTQASLEDLETSRENNSKEIENISTKRKNSDLFECSEIRKDFEVNKTVSHTPNKKIHISKVTNPTYGKIVEFDNKSICSSPSNEVAYPDFRTNPVSSKKRKSLSLGKKHKLQGIDDTKVSSRDSTFNFTHRNSSEHSHSGEESLPVSEGNGCSINDFEKDDSQVDRLYTHSKEAINDSCELSPIKYTNISNCSLTEADKNDMGNSQEFFDSGEESNFVIDTSAASDDEGDEPKCFRNENGVNTKEILLKDVMDKVERIDGDSKMTLPEKGASSDTVKKTGKDDMNSKTNALDKDLFGSDSSFDDSDGNKYNQHFSSESNISNPKNLYCKLNATENPTVSHLLSNSDPILNQSPQKRKNKRVRTYSSNSEEEPVKKKRRTKKKVKDMTKLPSTSSVGYNSLIENKSISKEESEQCPSSYPINSFKQYSRKPFISMVKKFVNEKRKELFADSQDEDKSTEKDCGGERDQLIRLNGASGENVSIVTKIQQGKCTDHGHEKIIDCLDSSESISVDISNSEGFSNEHKSSFGVEGNQNSHKNRRKQSLSQYRFVECVDQGFMDDGKSQDAVEALKTHENQTNEVIKSVNKPSFVGSAVRGKLPDCSVDENYAILPKKRRIAHTPKDESVAKEIETNHQEENHLYPPNKPAVCKPNLNKNYSSNSDKVDVSRGLKSKCSKLQQLRNKLAKAKGMMSSSNIGNEPIRQSPRKHFIFSNIGSSRMKDKGSASLQKISAPEKDIGKLDSNKKKNEKGTSSEELKSESEINVQDKKDASTSIFNGKDRSKGDFRPKILRSKRKENNGSKDSSLDLCRTKEKKCLDKELESLSAGQKSGENVKKKGKGLPQTPERNCSMDESSILSDLNSEKNIADEVIMPIPPKSLDTLSSPCKKTEASHLSVDCTDDVHKAVNLEESLENMEVPPPSPLSADELVDSFILYSNPNDENWTPMAPVKKCNASDITSCKDSVILTNNTTEENTQPNVVDVLTLGKSVPEIRDDNITISIKPDAVSKNEVDLIKDCDKILDSADGMKLGMEGAKVLDTADIVTNLISSDGNSSSLVNCNNDAKVMGSLKVDAVIEENINPSLQPKHTPSTEEESSQGVQKEGEFKDFFYKLMHSHKDDGRRKVKEGVIDGPEIMTSYKKELLKKELSMLQRKFFKTKDLDYLVAWLSDDGNAFEIKCLAKYLVRMLSKEDEDDIESAYVYHAPRLSTLQLRIISLILALERRCPKFEGFVNIIRQGISYMLFRLGHAPHVDIIMTLARIYTVLCKIENNIQLARIFCYDALFSLGLKANDLIFVVLSVWPEVLRKQSNDREADYIESSILCALSCQRNYRNESESKKRAVQNLIKNFYGCDRQKVEPNEMLNKFITALNDGKNLHGLEAAFVLLGKRQGWEWTHRNLLCGKLMDVMQDWKNGTPQNSAVVAINLIGLLSRSCAMETAGPIKPIIQSLSEVLLCQHSYDPLIQEALVTSVVRLSRYYQTLAIRTLDLWVPKSLPSECLVNMIISLIRRTPYGFWSQSYRQWFRKPRKPAHINVCQGPGTYSTPGNIENAFSGNIANKYDENSNIECEDGTGRVNGKRVWKSKGKGPANSRWIAKFSESKWLKKEEETWKNIAWVKNAKQSPSVSLGNPC